MFPSTVANDCDSDGTPSIIVNINSKKTIVHTEEPVTLEYDVFCVLRDSGIISKDENYQAVGDFDPLAYDSVT
jgi:hypothetical protein